MSDRPVIWTAVTRALVLVGVVGLSLLLWWALVKSALDLLGWNWWPAAWMILRPQNGTKRELAGKNYPNLISNPLKNTHKLVPPPGTKP